MYIRRAIKKDLPKIVHIIETSFHQKYPAAGEFYSAQHFSDPNYASSTGPYYSPEIFIKSMVRDLKNKFRKPFDIFIAKINKKIVGFIIIENNARNFWINNMMIQKEYQGKGIGKKLFNYVFKNKKPIYLWVNAKNPATKFWAKLGFKEVLREILMIKK